MIKQVHIQNFKCLRDVTVELEPFTVLIGPNDSGKSSFLQACQVVAADNAQIPKSLHWQCNEANKVVVELVRGDGVLRRF